MKIITVKQMVIIALLIAIQVVLTRFLSIPTPIVRIDLGFIPIVIIAVLFGPVYAGIAGAMADFIGAMLFPFGPFFPGFTFSAFLIGAAYGLFLYKCDTGFKPGIIRIVLAAFIVTVVLQLGLETLWVSIISVGNPESEYSSLRQAYTALLYVRGVRTAFMLPIQIVLIKLMISNKNIFYTASGMSVNDKK